MLYLGIDLHAKQVTISLRNEDGDVILRRQVSTRWPKLAAFREQLHQTLADDERYVAVVEVCGFHDWVVKWLQEDERCHQVLVIQPLGRTANKTDRRDANALSELLWVNRDRLLRGDRVRGVRTVHLPNEEQQADRHLTQLRERLVRKRTQTVTVATRKISDPDITRFRENSCMMAANLFALRSKMAVFGATNEVPRATHADLFACVLPPNNDQLHVHHVSVPE
jgi:transposase